MSHPRDIPVRNANLGDVVGMARVHVESWRETYRGAMPDEVLDDPGAVERREHFWNAALTDPRYADNRAVVAEADERIVGIAMAGPAEDLSEHVDSQLYLIYLLQSVQGSGAGQAMLDAVLKPEESMVLWVADPNPRAQAFYRRNGFQADGAAKEEDGVRAIRMVRPPSIVSGSV